MIEAGTGVDRTTGCPPGMSGEVVMSSIRCASVLPVCQMGTAAEEIGKTCIPCTPGFVLNNSGSCVSCPELTISAGGVIVKCTRCRNKFISNSARTECIFARISTEGFAVINGKCRKCPAGTSFTFGAPIGVPLSKGTCEPCAPGLFSTTGRRSCLFCPEGTAAGGEGNKRCKRCNKGTVPVPPGLRPQDCLKKAGIVWVLILTMFKGNLKSLLCQNCIQFLNMHSV